MAVAERVIGGRQGWIGGVGEGRASFGETLAVLKDLPGAQAGEADADGAVAPERGVLGGLFAEIGPGLVMRIEAGSLVTEGLQGAVAEAVLAGDLPEFEQRPGDAGGSVRDAGTVADGADGFPTPAFIGAGGVGEQQVAVGDRGFEQTG